jgi:hypothetical protein
MDYQKKFEADELQKYMTGIITRQKQKLLAINNMPDHFHLLIGLKPKWLFRTWWGTSSLAPQDSLASGVGCLEDSPGKKALGVFLFSLATDQRNPLHPKPGEASRQKNLSD